MSGLMRLVAAAGALAGVQAVAVTPAAAGHCGYYSYHGYAGYYAGCCPRHYEVVRHYQPVVRRVVRTVTYHRVVGYRSVAARSYYRPCCR